MDDLISRQAAIDAIMKKPAWHGSDGSYYHSSDIRQALESLPSAQPDNYAKGYNDAKREIALSGEYERAYQRGKEDAQKWIPCSERLPKLDNSYSNSKEYLVQWDNGRIDITRYSNVSIFWQNEITEPYWKGEQCSKVIAWMPLPKPYKGEEE